MGNTIDAPFRRVQNSAASDTSFGGDAGGSEILREFPVFPCFDCSPGMGHLRHTQAIADERRSNLGIRASIPCKFPCFLEKSSYETASSAIIFSVGYRKQPIPACSQP